MHRAKQSSDIHLGGMRGDSHPNNKPSEDSISKKNIQFLRGISDTFGGGMAGIGLIFIGVFVLFLNESSIVISSQRLADKLNTIADVPSLYNILQENNNRLVYISGPLKTNHPLTDGQFGIEAHALKLRREVQMFQWVEHRRAVPSGSNEPTDISTVYTKEWRSDLIDSDSFIKPERHQNKKDFPVKSTTFVATHAYVGSYYIKEALKEKIEEFSPLPPIQPKEDARIQMVDGFYYQTGVSLHPDIGDVRARFFYCGASGQEDNVLGPPQELSILAKQVNGQLTRFRKGNDRLDVVHFGKETVRELVIKELNIKTNLGWTLRVAGFVFLLLGFMLANSIMYKIASTVPEVQDFFLVNPLRFHLLASFCLLVVITILCWISLKVVFLLFAFVVVFIPFVMIIKFGSDSSKKASSKV